MGEFGELLVKAISATLGKELAKYPFFAEHEWPIIIGLICLAVAILVIRERRSTQALANKPTKEYGRAVSTFLRKVHYICSDRSSNPFDTIHRRLGIRCFRRHAIRLLRSVARPRIPDLRDPIGCAVEGSTRFRMVLPRNRNCSAL
jgi:hypothetical protein